MIKLIILDVDGIMTDGKKYYGQDGSVYLKSFCDKDWTSIKRFKSSNCLL
jgi:3-deoxy-D-manno-octulosonate 8-phosphate phosphatase KdsC-like HAD superfamily phosphatase